VGTGHAGWASDQEQGNGRTGEAWVTIWRPLKVGLTVPLLFGGLLLATARPAVAYSCAWRGSDAQHAARADAVFVGTLVSRVDRIDWAARDKLVRESRLPSGQRVLVRKPGNDTSRAVLTYQVSRVYKGAVGKRQEIVIPLGWSEGGGVNPRPGPFLVFAYKPPGERFRLEPGQYVSGICSGSRLLADGGPPALGGPRRASEPGWPDSPVGVGVLVAGVAAGLGLAAFKARRRASAG
jgi:hypothetical protein